MEAGAKSGDRKPNGPTPASALDPTDTIAAIASPPGPGHRGIVRLSGPHALTIALVGFRADEAGEPKGGAVRREGRIKVDGVGVELPSAVMLWPGPKSYTGGPLAEIHTVGSPPLLRLVLAQTLANGARLAEPGEFTLRAFLSGRIDLTRAEAVLGVIEAETPDQLGAALSQLAGGLAQPVAALRDRLLDVIAHLEANLDFVDEPDVDPLGRAALAESLSSGSAELAAMADRLRSRDRASGRPRVVLVGPPNAGKSRLFNALLGSDHALVSPVAGTTRDYLTAPCDCDGLTVELIDTAGQELALNPIEARAQALRDEQARRADLLLLCDAADGRDRTPSPAPDRPSLRVMTKSDLVVGASSFLTPDLSSFPPYEGGIEGGSEPSRPGSEETPSNSPFVSGRDFIDIFMTSAETGDGLALLRIAIARALGANLAEGDVPSATAARCRDGLARASGALGRASDALALGLGDELVSVDLREAVDDLGRVVGAVVNDDVLDRIFRRFCIGK